MHQKALNCIEGSDTSLWTLQTAYLQSLTTYQAFVDGAAWDRRIPFIQELTTVTDSPSSLLSSSSLAIILTKVSSKEIIICDSQSSFRKPDVIRRHRFRHSWRQWARVQGNIYRSTLTF